MSIILRQQLPEVWIPLQSQFAFAFIFRNLLIRFDSEDLWKNECQRDDSIRIGKKSHFRSLGLNLN